MDYEHRLTEEQRSLRELFVNFLRKEVQPYSLEFERAGGFPQRIIDAGKEMGVLLLELPEEYGGFGIDAVTGVILSEACARIDANFMALYGTARMIGRVIMKVGTEEQKQMIAERLKAGHLGSLLMTEPGAGSDVASIQTKAERQGDNYVLNGRKCFATNAGIADMFMVIASTNKELGGKGLSCFLVDRNTPGVSVGKPEDKMGYRLSDTRDVIFEDAVIPASCRIGEEGKGFVSCMQVLDTNRPLIAAAAVGMSQHAIDLSVKYANERIQFGRPISKIGAIQTMLADMQMRTSAARALTYYAAEMVANGTPSGQASAEAKCFATEALNKTVYDAVQIHGGYGYMKEYEIERLYRDARVYPIFEGTSQIQRLVIARAMIKASPK